MGQWRQPQTKLQKYPRVSTAIPIRISTVDAEIDPTTGRTFFRSAEETTANLSCGGAYVRSWEPLAADRRVILSLDVPKQGERLELLGRVVWTRRELQPQGRNGREPTGYGVEFIGGSAAELAALGRHLNALKPRFASSPTTDANPVVPQP